MPSCGASAISSRPWAGSSPSIAGRACAPPRRTTCRSSAARRCRTCFSTPATARWAGRLPAARPGCWPTSFPAVRPKWRFVFSDKKLQMRNSESQFLDIRGLKYHVRRWAQPGAPKMVLLHGWMDVSASFQFLVDALRGKWDVFAPDWRGYGLSAWGKSDCYWFPDYIADLEFLLDEIEPEKPLDLVAHSLGGNVAALYAGIRPERVAKLVNLEGFGLPPTRPEQAPKRYSQWLEELRERPHLRP